MRKSLMHNNQGCVFVINQQANGYILDRFANKSGKKNSAIFKLLCFHMCARSFNCFCLFSLQVEISVGFQFLQPLEGKHRN